MTEENCPRCAHPFDPHLMVATGESPIDGGVMLCPVRDCRCFATWSTNAPGAKKRDEVLVPTKEEMEAFYEAAWKEGDE